MPSPYAWTAASCQDWQAPANTLAYTQPQLHRRTAPAAADMQSLILGREYLPAPQMVVSPRMKSVSASVGMVKGRHRSWLGVTTACSKLPALGSSSLQRLLALVQADLVVAWALGVTASAPGAACCPAARSWRQQAQAR